MKSQKIEISYKTIIFTVLFLIGLYVLWSLRSILLILFVCFILAEALNPTVSKIERAKVPRPLAIIIVYIIIISAISFTLAGIIPGLVDQTSGLIETLPRTISSINIFGLKAVDLYSQFKLIDGLPANLAKATLTLFSDIFTGFVVLVITFYLLLEKKSFPQYARGAFGVSNGDRAAEILSDIEKRLSSWVNAEIFLMISIGLLSYIGYLVLGLNYAMPLAIIAGVLEIVPNIGPTVAAVLAAVVGLSISPLTAGLAILWGIIVQQLENNFIVPKIMRDTVGLRPLVTILLIASGAKLAGIVGALLAVPLYLTVEVVFNNLTNKK